MKRFLLCLSAFWMIAASAQNVENGVVIIDDGTTRIANKVYSNNAGITEVVIPASVTTISGGAFSKCVNLRRVVYNATDCDSAGSIISPVFGQCKALTEVVIGEGVNKIPNSLFINCKSITNVEIPSSVREIGESAFSVTGLTEVTIPEGVTTIGVYAFGVTSMKKAILPASVESIGENAFPKATKIICPSGSYAAQWASANGYACDELDAGGSVVNSIAKATRTVSTTSASSNATASTTATASATATATASTTTASTASASTTTASTSASTASASTTTATTTTIASISSTKQETSASSQATPKLILFTTGTGQVEYTCQNEPFKGRKVIIYYHIPNGDVANMPVQFVMHGDDRNGGSYRNAWIKKSDEYGFVDICPNFAKDIFADSEYHRGNIAAANGSQNHPSQYVYNVIDEIFDFFVAHSNSNARSFNIYGHSAGGQFVHRMLTFRGTTRIDKAVSANAGWYTIPTNDTAFPYGTGDRTGKTSGYNYDKKALYTAPLTILLGTADTLRTSNLNQSASADRQGTTRLARGKYYYDFCKKDAKKLGYKFNWEIKYVEGAGHSNGKMGPAAADIIYGK